MSYIHVYTGKGKGKTTAAIGLVMRAYGAGLDIFFAQFLKKGEYSELKTLKRCSDRVVIRQYGTGNFIDDRPTQEDYEEVHKGMAEIREVLKGGLYDLVVLDEANLAIFYGIVDVHEFVRMLQARHPRSEVVITGRYAKDELLAVADLVTEMKEVKHYFRNGVEAREGIEK